MNRPLPFFAMQTDVLLWLVDVSIELGLAYTLAGTFDERVISTYQSLDAVPNLGISTSGNQITDATYLVHASTLSVGVRQIPQRSGGVRYSVDQRNNPEAIGIRFGGLFQEHWLIAGQLGAATEHPSSTRLHREFVRQLKLKFTKIRSYWVGPTAEQKLDGGMRLVVNHSASAEYDLARP